MSALALTPFTPVPATRAVGTINPPGDMNNTSLELLAMGGSYSVINATYGGGADNTGTSDSTTAFQDAITAAAAAGQPVIIPGGTYKIAGNLTATPPVTILGAGESLVTLNFTGSGDMLRINTTGSSSGFSRAILAGFTIDGTSASAGASGLHMGDTFRPWVDIAVQNFQGSGSKGAWFDNQYNFMEQLTGRIFALACTAGVVFDQSATGGGGSPTGSFDRAVFDIYLDTDGVGNGVVFQNGAFVIDGRLGIYGNMSPGTSQYACLVITGSNGAGHSLISQSVLNIGVELAVSGPGATAPYTINFGTSGSNYIAGCRGIMDFAANAAFTTANNATNSFQFEGPVFGDTKLWRTQGGTVPFNAGTGLSNGGNISTINDVVTVSPASNLTGMIMPKWGSQLGTPTRVTVINRSSSHTITMAVSGTSNVANGTDCVILPDTSMAFWWDEFASLWEPAQQPASGRYLCAPNVYAPGSSTPVSVTSNTLAAWDSGVICTNSFVAPASGNVVVGLSCGIDIAAGGDKLMLALAATGTVTPVVGNTITWVGSSSLTPLSFQFYVTGLAAGTSYQFDLLGAVLTAASATIIAFGATALTVGNAGAPVVMTVQAV